MLWRSFVGVFGLFGLAAVLLAQPPSKPSGGEPAKPGDAPAKKPAEPAPSQPANPLNAFKGNRLSADELAEKDLRDFAKMVRGQDDPPLPADRRKELLDKIPRYLIYRLTWEEYHGGLEKLTTRDIMEGTPPGGIDGIYKMLPPNTLFRPAEDADEQAKRDRQKKYLVDLRAASTPFLREVLKNRLLVARLNAAIVLERFAQFNQEEVADDFIAILEDSNEHDAVKHWAIKGLGVVFTSVGTKTPKDPKRLERGALAVYKWLDEHTKVPPTLLADLSEPEKDAIRYIRKEAIRALGEYRRPLIAEDAKANRRDGPVAELLVKIMANTENEVSPPSSWPEREEAAVALCNLQSKTSPSYQPDYVAAQVGRYIAALGAEASRDASRSTQRWQHSAGHLKAGTDALAADLKGNPAGAYFGKLMDRINPVLENLFDERKFQSAVGDLNEALNSLPPKGAGVFGSPTEKK